MSRCNATCLDLSSNNVCEYEVNLLTNENEENETLTQIVNDAESLPTCPHTRPSTLNTYISQRNTQAKKR